jgi:hypothetical protein
MLDNLSTTGFTSVAVPLRRVFMIQPVFPVHDGVFAGSTGNHDAVVHRSKSPVVMSEVPCAPPPGRGGIPFGAISALLLDRRLWSW